MRHRYRLLLAVFLLAIAACHPSKAQLICLVGDSTAANSERGEIRGWGQFLPEHLAPKVRLHNDASSGRSSKSFLDEGHLAKALLSHPDFVLIQFGTNDPSTLPALHTDARTGFRERLREMVRAARKAGALPILLTPCHLRRFVAGQLQDWLEPYAEAVRAVAREEHVPLLDLYAASAGYFQALGETESAHLGSPPGDQVHFNEQGARAMAILASRELAKIAPGLVAPAHL